MKFHNIAQIRDHQFAGNYHSDAQAFAAIDDFVQNTSHTIQNRAEALRIMSDKGMGCGRDEQHSDQYIIAEYMAGL